MLKAKRIRWLDLQIQDLRLSIWMSSNRIFPKVIRKAYNKMNYFLAWPDTSKFEDISAVKGNERKRVDRISAWLNLLCLIAKNVVSLTLVRDHLITQKTYVYISVYLRPHKCIDY